tara:strand:+ start:98 stop:556 length:459 start_codon:yes stop_codon:yes gene_type:complete
MKFLKQGLASFLFLFSSVAMGTDLDHKKIELEVMKVLSAFMASFSARDSEAHTATYHFPHFRLAGGELQSWPIREDAIQSHVVLFENLPSTGWHRSVWLDREIVSVSKDKVHVSAHFQRLREDGSELLTTKSFYVLIKKDGRWGVKLRSSFL